MEIALWIGKCDNTLIDNIETEERAIVGLLAYDSDQLGEKKFELEAGIIICRFCQK